MGKPRTAVISPRQAVVGRLRCLSLLPLGLLLLFALTTLLDPHKTVVVAQRSLSINIVHRTKNSHHHHPHGHGHEDHGHGDHDHGLHAHGEHTHSEHGHTGDDVHANHGHGDHDLGEHGHSAHQTGLGPSYAFEAGPGGLPDRPAGHRLPQPANGYFGPKNPIRYDFSGPALPRAPRRPPSLKPAPRPQFPPSRFSPAELEEIVTLAARSVEERLVRERAIIEVASATPTAGWTLWKHGQKGAFGERLRNISEAALVAEEATRVLANRHGLDASSIAHELPLADVRATPLGRRCPRPFEHPCAARRYRSFTGHCNNVRHAHWGSAGTRYGRVLAPRYSDGVSEPRMRSSLAALAPLPSARNASLWIHRDADRPHAHVNVMLVALAEFVALDLAYTTPYAGRSAEPARCCGVPIEAFHPECFPVRVPAGDPAHPRRACLNYVRSAPALRTDCTLGPREQINQVTSFLDASPLYGSSEEHAAALRTFRGGELRSDKRGVSSSNGGEMTSPMADSDGACAGGPCFMAGDLRVNENAPLAAVHTLWLREHNRLARELAVINPHWVDHELFEEARRVVIAELQHVVFSELLPAVIGPELVETYKLRPLASGYSSDYNSRLDPSTTNEAATAALRFVVSMMPSTLELVTPDRRLRSQMDTSKTFFSPNEVRAHMNSIVLGMLDQHAQSSDVFVSAEMTDAASSAPKYNRSSRDNVFQDEADVIATLIQQGRDHGIPGYTEYRKFCGLSPEIRSFDDLASVTDAETARKLSFIYSSIDDVDLIVGGLAEFPATGAIVGPTFGCLLALQFQRTKHADRFYYEYDLPPSRFDERQLAEIRRITFARLLCDNAGYTEQLQPASLVMPDQFLNAGQRCAHVHPVRRSLSAWRSRLSADAVSAEQIRLQLERARQELDQLRSHERQLQRRQGRPDESSSQAVLSALLRPNEDALRLANESLLLELASKGIVLSSLRATILNRDNENSAANIADLLAVLPTVELPAELRPPQIPGHCDEAFQPCDHTSKFRTITGWCNNLQRPSVGKSLTPFRRVAPARYADGVSELVTVGYSGKPLPGARIISTSVHYDIPDAHRRYSLMVMQWGQFLDHDVTLTPMVEYPDKSNINCKRCDSASSVHPECRPIKVPSGDAYFPEFLPDGSENCISFVRSLPGQRSLGARQQLNQVTAFVDASNVYGSNRCEMRRLRTYRGGRLNVTEIGNGFKPLLPQTATHKECRAPSGMCFTAGDNRASEQPGLAVMHTVWVREHNRIVKKLSAVNNHWDDERLYQEGRRIVSAEMQQITYGEFLPRILGRAAMTYYGLDLRTDGYSNDYDSKTDPTVTNEFSTAAFRFGHTLIAPFFRLLGNEYRDRDEPIQLRKGFFNSDMLYKVWAVDALLRGLLSASMLNFDSGVTSEVTNHLFEERRKPFSGMDLIALNIQRARDHGLAGYNDYRVLCNLSLASSFDDLSEIPEEIRAKLSRIYAHVNDIDLFTGGLAERSMYGAVVGPTFACIIGEQFSRLKRGDRYFFESDHPAVRFTKDQLASIRATTLSRVICENSDNIVKVQRHAFDQIDDFLNPRLPCSMLSSLDLELWADHASCSTEEGTTIPRGETRAVTPCRSCTCTSEGIRCVSVRVTDCFSLVHGKRGVDVLADDVCRVQCGFVMAFSRPDRGFTSRAV